MPEALTWQRISVSRHSRRDTVRPHGPGSPDSCALCDARADQVYRTAPDRCGPSTGGVLASFARVRPPHARCDLASGFRRPDLDRWKSWPAHHGAEAMNPMSSESASPKRWSEAPATHVPAGEPEQALGLGSDPRSRGAGRDRSVPKDRHPGESPPRRRRQMRP